MNAADAMTTSQGLYGRVFDGRSFHNVNPPPTSNQQQQLRSPFHPVPPTNNNTANQKKNIIFNEATIFISIPQFLDGQRCGHTLHRLFESASHPERLVVGLIEQVEDNNALTCLEEYCALLGYKLNNDTHDTMEQHDAANNNSNSSNGNNAAMRQVQREEMLEKCPHALQIHQRTIRLHYMAAKGPVYARSFIRKILGNEEFCMQIDAATDFAQNWDTLAIQQWTMIDNEFAILSNQPQSSKEREKKVATGIVGRSSSSIKDEEEEEVPRHCAIKIGSEGVPLYETIADGKAVGLHRPLLSITHSSSFAFAKCHYEINVPHDPYAAQLLETEKFPRFARLWTRGYDVYTPAINIVYHDTSILHPLHHTMGHGVNGERKWPRNDMERRDAHIRMKVLLDIQHHNNNHGAIVSNNNAIAAVDSLDGSKISEQGGGGVSNNARANLGIYGLGQRRTLDQLLEFTGISLPRSSSGSDFFTGNQGNDGRGCINPTWVPYDASISPRANLFDGTGMADDLDLDPEFPMRTRPDAYFGRQQQQQYYDTTSPLYSRNEDVQSRFQRLDNLSPPEVPASKEVSYLLVFVLWAVGLCTWYGMFVAGDDGRKKKFGRVHQRQGFARISKSTPPRKITRKSNLLSERVMLKNV